MPSLGPHEPLLTMNHGVQVFKSHLDDRYSGVFLVSSHNGGKFQATPVSTSVQIAEHVREDTRAVAIDEARFLDDEDLVCGQ